MIYDSIIVTGSAQVSGSLSVTGGITGSFQGTATTASYVLNAVSASFATSAATATTASYILNAASASYALTSSFATTAVTASFANAFTVAGTLTATTLVVQTITSSVDFVTGSTRFGSLLANTHAFTGSVGMTGSLTLNNIAIPTSASLASTYLPLTGGTLTGPLGGTTATFSSNVTTGTKFISTAGNNNIVFESLSGTTGYQYMQLLNTTAHTIFGIEGTAAGSLLTGGTAYASVLTSVGNTNLEFGTNQVKRLTIAASTGTATFSIASGIYTAVDATSPNTSVYYKLTPTGGDSYILGAGVNQTNDFSIYNATRSAAYLTILGGASGGAATFSSSVTAGSQLSILGSDGGGKILYFTGGTTKYNFMIAAQQNVNNALEITPSTAAGGSTFSTPALTIASTGAATFSSTITAATLSTFGSAVAAQNVQLNLNGVSGKAQRIEFQNSGVQQWLIGAGAASETSAFEIFNSNGTVVYSVNKTTNAATFTGAASFSNSLAVGAITNSATAGRIDASNDVVAFSTSDERLKENIAPITNALDKINKIGGYTFNWKSEEDLVILHGFTGHDVGVIAQQIVEVLPEVVTTRESGYMAVKYEKLIPLLIEGIKAQQIEINKLKELIKNKS